MDNADKYVVRRADAASIIRLLSEALISNDQRIDFEIGNPFPGDGDRNLFVDGMLAATLRKS